MALDVTGKLIKLLTPQTGSGSRGNWVKQEFVIETTDQYPKKICMSVWGDKVDSLKSYNLGDDLKVSFNLESREYNERWYTDIRAWKIEPGTGGGSSSAPSNNNQNYSTPPSIAGGEEDDLPF